MSKHTPEPWHWEDGPGIPTHTRDNWGAGSGIRYVSILGPHSKGHPHVIVFEDDYQGGHLESNAARIVACVNGCKGINPAAVPDLLNACKKYLDAMDRYGHPDKTGRLMEAAIAKATREPQ